MTTAGQPKPSHKIITAARATHQFTIDKESLATWAKDTFESMQLAGGINKQEIESNLCQYILDYDKLTLIGETLFHSLQEKIPYLKDYTITGYGKDAGARISIDLGKSLKPSKYSVNNIPEGAVIPSSPVAGIKQIKDSISVTRDGMTLDGALLLGGLKSLADTLNASQPDLKKMDPEDREEFYSNLAEALKKAYSPFGISVEMDGQTLHLDIQYDKMMARLEKVSGSERGFTVKRGEDGTASILVDYRKIVDIAFEKAEKFASSYRSNTGKLEIKHDLDEAHITYTKEGLDGLFNAMINGLTGVIVKQMGKYQGHLRETMGTLASPKEGPQIPRF